MKRARKIINEQFILLIFHHSFFFVFYVFCFIFNCVCLKQKILEKNIYNNYIIRNRNRSQLQCK